MNRRANYISTLVILVTALSLSSISNVTSAETTKSWSFAEFGEPMYADNIQHWPYVNPDAPKGGRIILDDFGSFDTLNFYVLKGEWPSSIGLVYDSLMTGSGDEIGVYYGLIAESIEYPEDKSWAIFTLRPEARYHDGTPITAKDFVFALEAVKQHGRPFLKAGYEDVKSAEAIDDRHVKFVFNTVDDMKPLGQAATMYPLPVSYWKEKDVTASILEQPLSSGPYRVKKLEPGRSITYERVKDYWAADLPVNKGQNNFDEIHYDYYRDVTVMFEAFKAGKVDFRSENSAKRWATEYKIPRVEDGSIVKRAVPNESPRGISAYFINLRRPKFQDVRVRQALNYLYDFESIQRTLLYGYFKRIKSYFPNSDYGVNGAPTLEEISILEPFRDQLDESVFSQLFEPPVTDGSGRDRNNKRAALRLFKEAGWVLKDSKLVAANTGEQLAVEIMTASPESQRLALPYIENLRSVGIDATLRIVETAQWRARVDEFDYDLFTGGLNFFPPPGNLQRSYFHSEWADVNGSANMMGIKHPAIDAVLEQLLQAKDLETLKAANRALDRILLWQYYVIPLYYNDESWIAYWDKFAYPEKKPRYALGFPSTWWMKN